MPMSSVLFCVVNLYVQSTFLFILYMKYFSTWIFQSVFFLPFSTKSRKYYNERKPQFPQAYIYINDAVRSNPYTHNGSAVCLCACVCNFTPRKIDIHKKPYGSINVSVEKKKRSISFMAMAFRSVLMLTE